MRRDNCEAYWAVREFLKVADSSGRDRFVKAVEDGRIGLAGSHFNLTDLIPEFVHTRIMDEAKAERDALGITAASAAADVNGYSWGFDDVVARQGVKHLMSNTRHGYYPLGRKQTACWRESPRREKVLSWSGDHYIVGNELPFAPVSVCAYMTDNASPQLRVLEFCDRFNAEGHGVGLKMVTLEEFFEAVLASGSDIPTHRGDWTDWWAGGIGSTPAKVTQYRAAARSLRMAGMLDANERIGGPANYDFAYANLMFYGQPA